MPQNQTQQTQQKTDLKQVNKARNVSGDLIPEIHPLLRLQKLIGNSKILRLFSDDNQLQRLPEVGKAGGSVSQQLSNRITSQLGKGSPLPTQKRESMESHFGQSLEDVRLHTGEEAHNLNQSISARAFTLGNDVFFGNHANPDDDQLLTHELTHVVQQRSMPLGGPLTVGPSGDQFEQQAQSTARNPTASQIAYPTESVVQRDDSEDAVIISNLSGQYEAGASGGLAGMVSGVGDNATQDTIPSPYNLFNNLPQGKGGMQDLESL